MAQQFIPLLKRWLWLIILGTVLSTLVTIRYQERQSKEYEAQARLMIGPGIDSPSPDLDTLRASSYLMLSYAEMPTTEPFLQALIDDLKLNTTTDELRSKIEVKPNTNNQVLTVVVTYDRPDVAVVLANKTAERLINISPFSLANPTDPLKEQVWEQVKIVEQSVSETEARVQQLEADLDTVLSSQENTETGAKTDTQKLATLDLLETSYRTTIITDTKLATADQIFTELQANANARLSTLEAGLEQTSNTSVQSLLIEQIAKERTHISNIQEVKFEFQQLYNGQTLEKAIQASEALITKYQTGLARGTAPVVSTQGLLADEQERLKGLQQTATNRDLHVLNLLANERARPTEMQAAQVEIHSLILQQLDQERKNLDDSRQTLALLFGQLQSSNTIKVTLIDPAITAIPTGLGQWAILLLSAITGLVISTTLILAIEYLSNRIQKPEELFQLTGNPVLGIIQREPLIGSLSPAYFVVEEKPSSQAAESYRLLGTKFLFSPEGTTQRRIVLLPVQTGENAARIAVNLAVILAQTGNRTILIDANFQKSYLTKLFGAEGCPGLYGYLSGDSQSPELLDIDEHPGFSFLPSGAENHNVYQLLSSSRMDTLDDLLSGWAEILIISAPAISYAESLLLISHLKGENVLVAYYNSTSRPRIKRATESLSSIGASLKGSVFSYNNPNPSSTIRFISHHRRRTINVHHETEKVVSVPLQTVSSQEAAKKPI